MKRTRRTGLVFWRGPLFALALLAGVSSASGADQLERLRGVLVQKRHDTRADEKVVQQLVRLGPDALPELVRLATGEGLDALVHGFEGAWVCGPDRFGELARRALAAHPAQEVVGHLAERLGGDPELHLRLQMISLLGEQGTRQALELVLDQMEAIDANLLTRPAARQPIVGAITDLLEAREMQWQAVTRRWEDWSLPVARLVAEALQQTGDPLAFDLFASRVGEHPDFDQTLLKGMATLARTHAWELSEAARDQLRPLLHSDDESTLRQVMVLVTDLHDEPSTDRLLELCDHPSVRLRNTAVWCLQRLTGTELPQTSEEWQGWVERERDWWHEEGQPALAGFESSELEPILASTRLLARHPLFRRQVAAGLRENLPHLPDEALPTVCRTLAKLEARESVPELVELLLRPEEDTRLAAWKALRQLTGQELPADAWAWREYLRG